MFCRKCRAENPDDSVFCQECGTQFIFHGKRGLGSATPTPSGPISGSILGAYRVERHIGSGGMSVVYEGRDLKHDRRVAVKMLASNFSHDDQLIRRFQQEAEVMASLRHPNIVRVYDFVSEGERHAIIMEYVEGMQLKEMLATKTGALMVPRIKDIMLPVIDAICLAHSRGIIHRDLKPANIVVVETGEQTTAKVLDFGIAKVMAGQMKTRIGQKLGTPAYMAPEQHKGTADIGHHADIYSLGVTLFEMATGKLPFNSKNADAFALAHINDPPPLPHKICPWISNELEAMILRALAKKPAQRFATASEMHRALWEVPNRKRKLSAGIQRITARLLGKKIKPPARLLLFGKQGGVEKETSTAEKEFREPTTAEINILEPVKSTWAGGAIPALIFVGIVLVICTIGVCLAVKNKPQIADLPAPQADADLPPPPPPPPLRPVPDGMVPVAGGSYLTGCQADDSNCFADERPSARFSVRPFAIMKHEVTAVQYDICVGQGACPSPGRRGKCNWQRSDRDNHPINCVTWEGAKKYCKKQGWDLPSEWQWEVAARGQAMPDYPWGDHSPTCDLTAMTNAQGQAGCGLGHTMSVGSRSRDQSWCGAMDMGGNVREWVHRGGTVRGRPTLAPGKALNRGGSWMMASGEFSTSHTRLSDDGSTQRPDLGFRCAMIR